MILFYNKLKQIAVIISIVFVLLLLPLTQPAGAQVNSLWTGNSSANTLLNFPLSGNGNIPPTTSFTCTVGCGNDGFAWGSAIDSSGNFWVEDWSDASGPASAIYKFLAASSGNVTPAASISGSNTLIQMSNGVRGGMCFDPYGDLWVTLSPGIGYGGLIEFSAAQLAALSPGANNIVPNTSVQYTLPLRGVACDSSGNTYSVGSYNSDVPSSSIYKYNNTGTLQWEITGSNVPGYTGGASQMIGIALDTSNNIYVTDHETSQWYKWDAGDCITANSPCNVAPDLTVSAGSQPEGITVDSSGHVYVVNTGDNSITVYDSTGTPIQTISGGSTTLSGPAFLAPLTLPTPLPSPTPTVTATATATPTVTATPTAAATPSQHGTIYLME